MQNHITLIQKTFQEEARKAAISMASGLLQRGEIVALPTETVYGLAANALDARAVRKIFDAKKRPPTNPLIVHVTGIEMAKRYVLEWPKQAEILAKKFWPGPLSLVLRKSPEIPSEVTAGGDTVAIRSPKHPIFQDVIKACNFPLAAPSANRSNHISPTTAEHVQQSLKNNVPLIIDAGPCQVGIESTVIDLTNPKKISILRPGIISSDDISLCLSEHINKEAEPSEILKSPGLLSHHYSPSKKLYLFAGQDVGQLLKLVWEKGWSPPLCALMTLSLQTGEAFSRIIQMPATPKEYAKNLYKTLYVCEICQVSAIFVELPPDTPAWQGVRDRLLRASYKE